MLTQESMENVQKTRRLFASAYGCKASRSFLIWSLSAAMSISVAPMMAEVSADVRNFGTQLVTQVKRVTGTIIDETGEPMIGVSVLVQGTTTGTVTDLDGKFVLEIPANATLVISYIGYKTQNIKVGSQHAFAIKMESDNEVLDEVVVIGYQTIKRKDLTGSVASVSGKTVSVMPVSNVAQAMQGIETNHNVRFQFIKWKNDITLGEMIVNEGLAENFATFLYGEDKAGPWVTKTDIETLNEYIKPIIRDGLNVQGLENLNAYLYGDEMAALQNYPQVGLPYCSGYACGYHLIKHYLQKTGKNIVEATLLPAKEILDATEDFWNE